MSLALNTAVTTPYSMVFIQNIEVGTQIETFNYSKDSGLTKSDRQEVVMSSGTGNTPISETMIHIQLANDTNLICSPDQKILTEEGELKKAELIVSGSDVFLANGTTAKVVSVIVSSYQGGTHIISTSLTPTTSLDKGNLFVANGIVVADYALDLGEPFNGEFTGLNPE